MSHVALCFANPALLKITQLPPYAFPTSQATIPAPKDCTPWRGVGGKLQHPNKSEKWFQKYQDEKYRCLCDVCEGNGPFLPKINETCLFWNVIWLILAILESFLCHWRPVTYQKKLSWIVANILKKRESLTLTMSWTLRVGCITPFQLNLVGV